MPASQGPSACQDSALRARVRRLDFIANQAADMDGKQHKPEGSLAAHHGLINQPVPTITVSPASVGHQARRPLPIQISGSKTGMFFHVPFDRRPEWYECLANGTLINGCNEMGVKLVRLEFQFPQDTVYNMQTHSKHDISTHMWVERSPDNSQHFVPYLAMLRARGQNGLTYLQGSEDVITACVRFLRTEWNLTKRVLYKSEFSSWSTGSSSKPSITLTCEQSKRKHGEVAGINYRITLSDRWKGPFPDDWELSSSPYSSRLWQLQALGLQGA